jgi:hypothetical protein
VPELEYDIVELDTSTEAVPKINVDRIILIKKDGVHVTIDGRDLPSIECGVKVDGNGENIAFT